MDLIDWLDRKLLGEEAYNRYKNKNQTPDSSPKKDANSNFTKEYSEGPFNIKREYRSDSSMAFDNKEKTIEGKVIRILGEKTMGYEHRVTGTFFLLETPKGNAEIEFPRIFSEDTLSKLENQTIKYCKNDNFYEELWGNGGTCDIRNMKYRIDILSGSLKEKYFQEEKID